MLFFYLIAPVLLCWQSIADELHEEPNQPEYEIEGSYEDYDEYYPLIDEEEYFNESKESYKTQINENSKCSFELISDATNRTTATLKELSEEVDDTIDSDPKKHGESLDTATKGSLHSLLPEITHDLENDEFERNARASKYEYYAPYPPYPYFYPDPWTGMAMPYHEYIPLAVPAQDAIPVEECLVPVQQVIPVKGHVTIVGSFTNGCYNFPALTPMAASEQLVPAIPSGVRYDNGQGQEYSGVIPVSGKVTVAAKYDDCGVINFPAVTPMAASEQLVPAIPSGVHYDNGQGQEYSGVIPVSGKVTVAAKYDDCGATYTQLPPVPVNTPSVMITNQNTAVVSSTEVCGKVPAHGQVTIAAHF